MFVTEEFRLNPFTKRALQEREPRFGFGALGQIIYGRTYSRLKDDGAQEGWADTVTRVVEGWGSILKTQRVTNRLPWDEDKWQGHAVRMANAVFDMRFLPPGRGLWVGGTSYIAERGAMAHQNCAYCNVRSLSADAAWVMDALMCGVGVGFGVRDANFGLQAPSGLELFKPFVIPDSREGWVESLRLLIKPYEDGSIPFVFDYSQIRPAGSPIRGFGGTASGHGPLQKLHERVRAYLDNFVYGRDDGYGLPYDRTRLIADIMNAIGACVVAGNVRRSAEIALGSPQDTTFLNLKNYGTAEVPGPAYGRMDIGWMSNNSVVLADTEDFKRLPDIAELIRANGEPGVMNLLNVQRYGRYGEEVPDLADGCNPCVTGDTLVLTRFGYQPIERIVGDKVDVWNGTEWSKVQPRITGKHQPIVRVAFDDGTTLDCTPYHSFRLSTSYRDTSPTSVEAKDLKPGDKLWKYDMPVVESGPEIAAEYSYTQGVYAGDGHDDSRGRKWVFLYGGKSALLAGMQHTVVYEYPERDRLLVGIPNERGEKTDVPHHLGVQSRLAWFAGLVDTDGTITKDGNIQVTSIDEHFLLETRRMLTTVGVQAKVTKNRDGGLRELPDGNGELGLYYCQSTYRLLLVATDVVRLRELGMGAYLRRVNIFGVFPNRDARRFAQVVSVEPIGVADTVYCFDEPKNHTGTFNGIVTGQCAEQALEDKEVCCLVEAFPTRCATTAEYLEALELAQLYAHTITLLPTHSEATNEVVARNHRIGESLSGIADWYDTAGASQIVTLQRQGYRLVREANQRLAKAAGVPESVRVTTVKPSGTISQLVGVSPGMHYPVHRRFIRRVRFGADTPLVPLLIEAGVPHEVDAYSDNTLVFEFPVQTQARRSQRDISMWQKGAMVVALQQHWADNMVSNTITFDPKTEGHQIEDFLAYTVPLTKTISMLPDTDEGAYAQMPYEAITVAEFERRSRDIRAIDWSRFGGSDGEDSRFCGNDNCEV